MPKGKSDDLLLFMVSKAHCVTALNGCHQDVGHQGHNHTLSLLQECFWWPGMINQVQKSIRSCMHCLQHEGNLSKVPLHPIVSTAPMDLLHIDITSIEMTIELNILPKVANILVFQDHFRKHVIVYVTHDQTAKTIAKFLYQGYISRPWSSSQAPNQSWCKLHGQYYCQMCKLLSVKKLHTMPYHPQTNGLVERSHQTIM